jgi:GNAT superfamily N-acetyltransferase
MSQVGGLTELQLSRAVALRPVRIDDVASVRYVHESAFLSYSAEFHTAQETSAFLDMVRRPDYYADLLRANLVMASIGGEIVGTAGWLPAAGDRASVARLRNIFVRPLFGGTGIGRMLLLDAEARAAHAGFFDFTVRTSAGSIAFYKRLGYRISSHGVFATPSGVDLPVTYMRKSIGKPAKAGYH